MNKLSIALVASVAVLSLFGKVEASPVHSGLEAGNQAPKVVSNMWIGDPAYVARAKTFKGHVTILHFWTFGCINCKHNLPHYNKWAKLYDSNKVAIVGIHNPETPGERNVKSVRRETKRWGITYPVVIDNDSTNWDNYHQQFWPSVYVIDQKGKVRGKWEGELQYDGQNGVAEVQKLVGTLLKEGNP